MKRQRVQDAYQRIRPSEAEKNEMLQNILSAASALPPAERNIPMKRRKMKPVLIAAIVALMVLLMGCAVVALNLADLKIGTWTYHEPEYIDENGDVVPETEKTKSVLSLQGVAGTPNQLAAKEWYEFKENYMQEHWQDISDDFVAPREYDAYSGGSQALLDKVDEICEKYSLKLAGREAYVDPWQVDIFFDVLGFDSVVTDGAKDVENLGGYFFACGNFKLELIFTLNSPEDHWKQEILASMRYVDKEYFDTVFWFVEEETAEQWNYTCADGTEVLIVSTGERATIFCDREDTFISSNFSTIWMGDNGIEGRMTKRDIELAAEALDFQVKPQKPDMERAEQLLEEAREKKEAEDAEKQKPASSNSEYEWLITDRLKNEQEPENLYYCMTDVNGDGVQELLLGSKESLDSIWMTEEGYAETVWTPNDGLMIPTAVTEEKIAELVENWPTMDTQNICWFYAERYATFVKNQILWRNGQFENPPQLYYYLMDYGKDGVVDLLFGYEEEFTFMWTMSEDGTDILPASLSESEWDEVSQLWLTLDIIPVEEFPMSK